MPEPLKPEVSVIIASHRSDYITGCLAAFTPDVYDRHRIEIIVVADYPTEALAAQFPDVQWKYHNDTSISAKRNIGIKSSESPVVAFIDDDCKPQTGWIVRGLAKLSASPGTAGIQGKTVIENNTGHSATLRENKRLETAGFRANNAFYRMSALSIVNRFDERFTHQREDMDLAFSLMSAGYNIRYANDALVTHLHRTGEHWDLIKNCFNRRFDPLLYRKHPSLYRQWVRSPFPPLLFMLFLMHLLLVWSPLYGRNIFVCTAVLDGIIVFGITLRRIGLAIINPITAMREIASTCIAPIVLSYALISGSIRYRKFLLF